MQRILTLSLLVLLALGFASQLQAQPYRIECTIDHGFNTWSWHKCEICDEYFDSECESLDGYLPPMDKPCPEHGGEWIAEWAVHIECTQATFWELQR